MSRLRTCAPLRDRIPRSDSRAALVRLRGDAGEGGYGPCPRQRSTWPRRTSSNSPAHVPVDDNVATTVPVVILRRNRFLADRLLPPRDDRRGGLYRRVFLGCFPGS